MNISESFRRFYRFYFNYRTYDLSSPVASVIFSRRTQYALQMVVSFLASGFLAYGTALKDQLSTQYLIPIMSLLTLQDTFGMTLVATYNILKGIVPLSIFLFVVQKIGLGYRDYLAAELVLLVSTLIISYKCSLVSIRRIILLISSVFFSTIVNRKDLPSTFIFQLLEEFVIGIAIGLMISLLFFPLFATLDIENRFNYSLANLQQMQTLLIQAFLCQDKMSTQVSLARAATISEMVRTTINPMQARLNEARLEPSRCLQRIFNRRRRHLIDLTLQEQENFITSLMFHVFSLHVMVKQCEFNDYHKHFSQELKDSLLHLNSCQSTVLSSFNSPIVISRDEFDGRLMDLKEALKALHIAYIKARLHRVEHVLEFRETVRSEDNLSHTFFLFQLATIARLFIDMTKVDMNKTFFQEMKDAIKKKLKKKRRSLREWLMPRWPRLISAFKSMVIIGVGSIFVMVPRLANTFENGQWVLIALCMTQGDTVGGALTIMKMRLVGTLLGAMWAYVTYLSVSDQVYLTFGMLVPWILVFGYLKPLPTWGYTAQVAAFTPVLINLGRIPYGDALPAGNYALLRIEENLVGIAVAIVLTLGIFPVFAIDVLKNNIQSTLEVCRQSIDSMHLIYDQLFDNKHLDVDIVDSNKENETIVKSLVDAQRNRFHLLISNQRTLVVQATLEPTVWWFQNPFSTARYSALVEQQLEVFQMLHNIDVILMRIGECSDENESYIQNLRTSVAGGYAVPNLHDELADLSRQLSDCLTIWASYFAHTQTRFYRMFRDCAYTRSKLNENDLLNHEQHLIELHRTIYRLQSQHQEAVNRLLAYYVDRTAHGDDLSSFVPYVDNEKSDLIIIGIAAMYYSTTQLTRAAIALGSSIHTIFELETTTLYRSF